VRKALPPGETPIRLFTALFGLLSLAGIGWIARDLGGPRAAAAAILIAALSPMHWLYSTEARPYALFLALSAFSTLFFLRALRGRARNWIPFALCSALNLLTHYFAVFLLIAQGAAWLAALLPARSNAPDGAARRRAALFGAIAFAAALLLFLPWGRHLFRIFRAAVLETDTVGYGSRIGRGMTASLAGRTVFHFLGDGVLPFLVQVPLLAIGLFARRGRPARPLFFFAWLSPIVLLLLMKPTHFIAPKYLLFAYPITAALVGAGAARTASRIAARFRPVPAALWIAAFALLPLLPGQHPSYAFHREDWRSVAADVASRLEEDDVLCFPRDAKSEVLFNRYAPKNAKGMRRRVRWNETGAPLFQPMGKADRVWLIRRRDLPEKLIAASGTPPRLVRSYSIYPRSIRLWLWTPPGEEGAESEGKP